MSDLPTPITREEEYLNAIATGNAGGLPTPITREEQYLDYIARNGGGSGDGDMKKSVYDSDLDVAGAGGIKAFVNSAVAGKVDKVEGKGLSTNDYTDDAKAIVDSVTGALAEKADTEDIPDLVSDNLAKGILGNETVLSTDNVPFVSKIMSTGKYQRKKFVGCSFVWNQMIENGDFSDGTTGWSIYNAVYGSISASNNVITLTANRAMPYLDVAFRKYNLNRKANHTYYISFLYKTTSSNPVAFAGSMAHKELTLQPTTEWTKIAFLTSRDTDNDNAYITFGFRYPAVGDTLDIKEVYMVDLTQLFGSTAIADYIYNLEQATAGAGVAKLKELGFFTEDYYAYDAGSVQSVNIKEYSVTGKNMTIATSDPSNPDLGFMTSGGGTAAMQYDASNGGYYNTNHRRFRFLPEKYGTYTLSIVAKVRAAGTNNYAIYTEGGSQKFPTTKSGYTSEYVRYTGTFEIGENLKVIQIIIYDTLYIKDMQIELGSTATAYEPYHKTTYSLTPTELRGVPKIDANNNIYCDGDEYASDGGHNVKYGIVDLGTLEYTLYKTNGFQASISNAINVTTANMPCTIMSNGFTARDSSVALSDKEYTISSNNIYIVNASYTDPADFKAAMSGVYLVYKKATPTTETLTPFDYPQSVGSLEEIVDYKVEQEDRDVAIPTGHVTEYMGKGGEFTLPTLPETPSVLAYDGHNFFWKPETA